jgi:hypothetical protein
MRKLILIPAVLLGACASGPKYRVDDKLLDGCNTQEKQGMLAAQNDLNVAKDEQRQAKVELDSTERDLDIANNEYKTAKLQKDTAKLQLEGAKQSGDGNRVNGAERDLHVAEMGVKAADAKVDWLEKKYKYQKKWRDRAELHASSAASRYELEKAKLVNAKGIKPTGDFQLINFETQDLDASRKFSEMSLDADKLKAEALDLERKYQEKNQQYTDAKNSVSH